MPMGVRSASAKDFKAGLCGPATWMMLPGHFSEMRKDGNISEISARYTGVGRSAMPIGLSSTSISPPTLRELIEERRATMWNMLRYYWTVARGYRLKPWKSPYLRWRFETFLGKEAAELDAGKFLHLLWKYRSHLKQFVDWAGERQQAQRRHA